jgi:hypothetical protein
MMLDEGNDALAFEMDDVHGTHHFVTAFRNYFSGWETGKTSGTHAVTIAQFSRFMNVVGNVLGTPGYHDTYESTIPGAHPAAIYMLGFPTNSAPIGDPLVEATLMRWGNYDVVTAATQWNAAEVPSGLSQFANAVPANHSLPDSLYLPVDSTGKAIPPPFFNSKTTGVFPPIQPDVNLGTGPGGHVQKIPAHICYDNLKADPNYPNKDPSGLYILSFNANNCY